MNQHKCGICREVFNSESDYMAHKCTTGFKPTQVQHQDALTNGRFSRISNSALERGEKARVEKEK